MTKIYQSARKSKKYAVHVLSSRCIFKTEVNNCSNCNCSTKQLKNVNCSTVFFVKMVYMYGRYVVKLAVRLGVRLGQVRLGQVRLGQVRLGQVRLGQVFIFLIRKKLKSYFLLSQKFCQLLEKEMWYTYSILLSVEQLMLFASSR